MLIRFILYGLGGWCGEVVYTAVTESIPSRDWRLVGRTFLWMFPIYGLIAVLYEPVHDLIREAPLILRAAVYSVGFTVVEYISGWVIERITGRCPWDYSDKRFAINKYVRWDFFIVWAVIGLALEPVHDLLVELTPAIQEAIRSS